MREGDISGTGIYRGVSMAEYLAVDAVNSHLLGAVAKSPAHARWGIAHPEAPTSAMRLGSALHSAILEPDRFAVEYTSLPDFHVGLVDSNGKPYANPRATKQYKELVEAFMSGNQDLEVLSSDEFSVCQSCAEAVHAHEFAGPLIEAAEDVEFVCLFEEPRTKLLCKCRPDFYVAGECILGDLKTTSDASPTAFARSIFTYGYYRQAAFYVDALRLLGKPVSDFVIVAIEKTPPFAVCVYRLLDEAIDLGRKENAVLLERYKRCVESGDWPGYPSEPQDIGIPVWAEKQLQEGLKI